MAAKWAAIPIAAVTLIPVLLLSTRMARAPAAATNTEPAGSLPLTLTGENGRLSVGWDRGAPAIRAGQCGVLLISDGGVHKRLILDVSQLRAGKLFYWPINKAVSFEIQMPRRNDGSDETACGNNATSLEQRTEGPGRRKPRAQERASRHRPHTVEPEDVSGSGNLPGNESNAPEFAIQGESQLAATLPVPSVPRAASGEKQISSTAIRPVPQGPLEAYATVTVEAVAFTESRLSRIASKVPLLRRLHRTAEFLPPKPVRESTPVVPAELRRAVKEVPLDVHAFIDESGKVTYAEILSSFSEADRGLASVAVFDARRWQFRPAQLGRDTVPSEMILHYRFGNPLVAVSRDQR